MMSLVQMTRPRAAVLTPYRPALLESPPRRLTYPQLLRNAMGKSLALTRERDPSTVRARVLLDTIELLGGSAGRIHAIDVNGFWRVAREHPRGALPPLATAMEAALFARAMSEGKSLLSSHPMLHEDLLDLAEQCAAAEITTHVLLLRAEQRTCGAVAVHWIGEPRPDDYEARS